MRPTRYQGIPFKHFYHAARREINFGVDIEEYRDQNPYSYLKLTYGLKILKGETKKIKINSLNLEGKTQLEKNKEEIFGTRISIKNIKANKYEIQWKDMKSHFWLPVDQIIKYQKEKTYFCPHCKRLHRYSSHVGKDHYRFVLFKGGNIEANLAFENTVPRIIHSEKNIHSFDYSFVLKPFYYVNRFLKYIFESFHYLGPLRKEPFRRYIYEEEPVEIGIKGEYAPIILYIEGKNITSPFYFYDSNHENWIKKDKTTLQDALTLWLNYLGISKKYKIQTKEEMLYLYLYPTKSKRQRYTLADVGFGVSQIIPILVEGLRSERGHTLILEQPEIHLHPKLQMLLADFFISMALSDKKLLIETHSDHIINRLARRIVEDEKLDIISKTKVFFLEKVDNEVKINPIHIDESRGITNWPKDFFDQSAEETIKIVELGLRKRKMRKLKD